MTLSSRPGAPDALVAWLCPTIARACHVEATSVTGESRLLELNIDSLTLVSVLTQVEAVHGIELRTEETLELLESADVRALARTLARLIASRRSLDEPG